MPAIRMRAIALAAARHGEIGVERHRAAGPAIDLRDRPDHEAGVEHMVIEREIVRRDVGDAERMLTRPVGGAKRGGAGEQVIGAALAGPVAFEGRLELAARTDPRRTERADRQRGRRRRHRLTPNVWGQRPSGRMRRIPARRTAGAGAPPGHPAQGRYEVAAGLLARGSPPRPGLPEALASVTRNGPGLAAHSCGGSSGVARPFGQTHRIPS